MQVVGAIDPTGIWQRDFRKSVELMVKPGMPLAYCWAAGRKEEKVKDSKLGKTRPTQQKKKQRKYGECPICSASIPLAFLQRHVDSAHFSSNSSADQTLLETNDSSEDASGPSTGKSVCSLVSTNKGQNAFSTLMENAKKKAKKRSILSMRH